MFQKVNRLYHMKYKMRESEKGGRGRGRENKNAERTDSTLGNFVKSCSHTVDVG